MKFESGFDRSFNVSTIYGFAPIVTRFYLYLTGLPAILSFSSCSWLTSSSSYAIFWFYSLTVSYSLTHFMSDSIFFSVIRKSAELTSSSTVCWRRVGSLYMFSSKSFCSWRSSSSWTFLRRRDSMAFWMVTSLLVLIAASTDVNLELSYSEDIYLWIW